MGGYTPRGIKSSIFKAEPPDANWLLGGVLGLLLGILSGILGVVCRIVNHIFGLLCVASYTFLPVGEITNYK